VLVWDIRRKKGLAEWLKSFVSVAENWSRYGDRKSKRRDDRKMQELRAAEDRREFREQHRRWPAWLRWLAGAHRRGD
jgi:hypothetical protein